jgi:FtsH-binding integral membrane protein
VYTGASVASAQFLFMSLIGIVLASLVNIFWQNDGLQFVISFRGDRVHRYDGL